MTMWEQCDDDQHSAELSLSLSPEGVRFLREQWAWLRELVRWELRGGNTDPLAQLTGMPVLSEPLDERLACVVDHWCGTDGRDPVRRVREGWLLFELEQALGRVLSLLPRCGGVVRLPGRRHPTTTEWELMLETLHVVLDCANRRDAPDSAERAWPARAFSADVEQYWLSMRWLELVLDALDHLERTPRLRASFP